MSETASTRVDFYVLAGSELADKYAYACRIANKAYTQGLKVYMQTDDSAQSEVLDKMLWTFSQNSFVPHAIYHADSEEHAIDRYPVQIGYSAAPSAGVDLLISFRHEAAADYARFARVIELIINQFDDKSTGRNRYRFYRQQGITPHTHKVS